MADTNFSQWNPTAANQENDATYHTDAQRTGGAVSGVFPSQTANKEMYQPSTFIRALALALVAKGYSPKDGTSPYTADTSSNAAVTALQAVLSNIMTSVDVISSFSIAGGQGYVKFGTALGGLTLQWGTATALTPATPHVISFSHAFTNFPVTLLLPLGSGVTTFYQVSNTLSDFTMEYTGAGNQNFYWFSIGN